MRESLNYIKYYFIYKKQRTRHQTKPFINAKFTFFIPPDEPFTDKTSWQGN